jgi:hypothetical protein
MRRYRVTLARMQADVKARTELVYADDANTVDGILKLKDRDGSTVAVYQRGAWTRVRVVGQR